VQGGNRLFTPINPTARKLKLGLGLILKSQKRRITRKQDRIDTWPALVGFSRFQGLAKSSVHVNFLGLKVAERHD
jgi:hypothetical protein